MSQKETPLGTFSIEQDEACCNWCGQKITNEAKIQRMKEALKRVREDINWMLNNRQFLNSDVFNYLDEFQQ